MNTATAMALYIGGCFVLIFAFIRTPSIQYYTGGVIIALFISGLLFAWGNSIVQTRRIEEQEKSGQTTSASPAAKS